jgi:hypothetical protein
MPQTTVWTSNRLEHLLNTYIHDCSGENTECPHLKLKSISLKVDLCHLSNYNNMSSSLTDRIDTEQILTNCIHLEDLVRPPCNSVTAANQAALWRSSGIDYTACVG